MNCVMRNVLIFFYLLTISGTVKLKEIGSVSLADQNLTRHKRSVTENNFSCTLPPHPSNGRWILVNGEGREGEQVDANSLLRFHCKKGYELSSRSPYLICDKKWSSKSVPECLKLCPAMHSTSTTIVNCTDKHGSEIDCHKVTDGGFLSYTCAPFYEAPFGYKTTYFCSDGDWSSANPICQPICGKKVHDDTTPLIYGGKVEEVIEYPWIATLYRKGEGEYTNVCGGSILSQKLILTAAHCVTNQYGDTLPAEDYLVAAGKLHNKYNDSRDPHAQYVNVFRIIVQPSYKGNSRRFLGDIAILVTKERFVLNKLIQPVCFNDLKNINLQVGTIGVVAGFGVKEDGEPSEELRSLEIPYKSEATCAKELPGDWGDRYNVIDKLCAGHYNKSMSICKGDSGNGLFFRNSENKRYYVHGVVSLGHSEKGQCNVQQNSLYTKVAFHYDFIDREISRYYVKDCSLPPYPENGKWVTERGDKEPGDNVPSDTILEISCKIGYKLSSDTTRFKCESSFIMPTCHRLCPEVQLSKHIKTSCRSKEGEAVSCNDATEGATLNFTCPEGYESPDGLKNTRQCLKGTWESPTPVCQIIETLTEKIEEPTPTRIVCIYNGKQYESGVKPEELNATLCTHVIYESAGLSQDGNLRVKRSTSDIESYRSIADMKERNKKLKILLSVYGSAKAEEYSKVAADPVKRTTFIASVTNFLETYGYDGLNVYWDVPRGAERENYITLMKEIRESFEQRGWLLTATVYFTPIYLGYNPSVLVNIVDWINIACYGLHGEFSKYTGQSSPLYRSSLESDFQQTNSNLQSCASNWYLYGVIESKLFLSISFVGVYYTLKDPKKHGVHAPVTGSTASEDTGRINYSEICQKYGNWKRVWDNEQKNPYKYYNRKWIGYDDEESVKLKAAFIKEQGYGGVTVYSIDADDVQGKCGPKQILLKQVIEVLLNDE